MPDPSYALFYHVYLTRVSSIFLHIIFYIHSSLSSLHPLSYPVYTSLRPLIPAYCRGDYPPSWQSWHCSRTFSTQTDFV